MLNLIKKYWLYILLVLALAGTIFYFNTCNPLPKPETIIIHDTTTFERYNERIDTVSNNIIKRIFSEQSEPTVIYKEKIKEIDRFKNYPLGLGYEKKGTTLRIFAINLSDSTITEQIFENVYNNFSAYSANDRIVVKSNKFEWTGITAGYEHKRNINDLKGNYEHNVNLMTGIKFKDRYQFSVGTEYDFNNKDIKLKGEIKVKLTP